jgi:hypothetical protein
MAGYGSVFGFGWALADVDGVFDLSHALAPKRGTVRSASGSLGAQVAGQFLAQRAPALHE